MITLAAGGGDYLFLVIMLVAGLINWLATKAKEGKPSPPAPRRPAPRPDASQAPGADAEAERMRRFLEALGVPAAEAERPAPAPVAPPPVPVARRPAPPPLPPRESSLDEAETTTEPARRIHIPELQTPVVREIETLSSRVAADADGEFVTFAGAMREEPEFEHCAGVVSAQVDRSGAAGAIVERLRSQADVRAALILGEILGRPKGLR